MISVFICSLENYNDLDKSVWPIQATISEIPSPVRDFKSAVMLLGAWFATVKPRRDILLIPIATQLEALMTSTILLKQVDGNVSLTHLLPKKFMLGSRLSYNVRIQQAIFDLPARAHFLNIVQYNGYDGCGDCYIKGLCGNLVQWLGDLLVFRSCHRSSSVLSILEKAREVERSPVVLEKHDARRPSICSRTEGCYAIVIHLITSQANSIRFNAPCVSWSCQNAIEVVETNVSKNYF
jgi:hypothetical protein